MQTLPLLLADSLPAGTVRTATEVTEVTGSVVRTSTGQEIQASAVVIATDGTAAAALAPGLAPPAWHPVTKLAGRACFGAWSPVSRTISTPR